MQNIEYPTLIEIKNAKKDKQQRDEHKKRTVILDRINTAIEYGRDYANLCNLPTPLTKKDKREFALLGYDAILDKSGECHPMNCPQGNCYTLYFVVSPNGEGMRLEQFFKKLEFLGQYINEP